MNDQLCTNISSSAVEGFETTVGCIIAWSLVSYTEIQRCALACGEEAGRAFVMQLQTPSPDYSCMSFCCFGSITFVRSARLRTQLSAPPSLPIPDNPQKGAPFLHIQISCLLGIIIVRSSNPSAHTHLVVLPPSSNICRGTFGNLYAGIYLHPRNVKTNASTTLGKSGTETSQKLYEGKQTPC
jgi:hypothetical protein